MLAPLSWLKDYVDIDVTPKELEEKLFSCGFEVEELIEVGKDISNVVVGLVEECEPIPDTHLSLFLLPSCHFFPSSRCFLIRFCRRRTCYKPR